VTAPPPVKPVFDGAGEPPGGILITPRTGAHAENEMPWGGKKKYTDERKRNAELARHD